DPARPGAGRSPRAARPPRRGDSPRRRCARAAAGRAGDAPAIRAAGWGAWRGSCDRPPHTRAVLGAPALARPGRFAAEAVLMMLEPLAVAPERVSARGVRQVLEADAAGSDHGDRRRLAC